MSYLAALEIDFSPVVALRIMVPYAIHLQNQHLTETCFCNLTPYRFESFRAASMVSLLIAPQSVCP